jgi:hypothetical protein
MRLARVATCTATAVLLTAAAGLGTASAATADKGVLYTSSTNTGVVQVTLTLPDTIPALPGVPNPLVLTLIGTDAVDSHRSGAPDVGASRSFLAGGSLVTDSALAGVLGPLNRVLTSDVTHPGLKTASALTVPANPLGLELSVAAQKADFDAVSHVEASSGSLTSAQLGSLRSLGLGAVLDPALAALNTAVGTVTAQTSALTSALSALPTLPTTTVPNPLSGILGGPPAITTPALSGNTLTAAIGELPAQIDALTAKLLDGSAVTLNGVDTSQSITPALSSIAAVAHTRLLSVDLFGGLVSLTATDATATAKAALTKASATSSASPTLLSLKVSDAFGTLLQAVASDKGITAGLLDGSLGQTLSNVTQPIVTTVNAALDTVLAQLTSLLASLNSGASLITQGTVTHSVSANGHQAQAHALPAGVTIGLPVAPNLLQLTVGKADSVAALAVAPPAVVTPTTPELPHTGGSERAGLLALVLMVVGGATVALRNVSRFLRQSVSSCCV